jgi:hypothetical protein
MMVGLISGRGNIGVISPHVVTLALAFGWAAVTQQQFNQIRRKPSNRPNTKFSHSSSGAGVDRHVQASQDIRKIL